MLLDVAACYFESLDVWCVLKDLKGILVARCHVEKGQRGELFLNWKAEMATRECESPQ